MTVVALDGKALRQGGRGIARAMQQLIPLLSHHLGLDYVALVTEEGSRLLGPSPERRSIVPDMPNSLWEQVGLPWHARRAGAGIVFSSSECAALWGPRMLLHVPEDPHVRWDRMPATTLRERVRRGYQRVTMPAGIRRAEVVVASCQPTADALRARFGERIRAMEVIALGVDTAAFHASPAPHERWIFHLGSIEARDQSPLVVLAYARALEEAADLPDLVIGGDLGANRAPVVAAARRAAVGTRLRLVGRITDTELRRRYAHAAMCVQLTRYEGFGLQALEALACGAPLIASPDAAQRAVVGDAAVVVERDDDPRAVARAIVELWSSPAHRARLRAAGPRRAALFTWARTAADLHAVLLRLAESPQLRSALA